MTAIDSSVAVAAVSAWHPAHRRADPAAQGCTIAAHALVEVYSVLTRLPTDQRVDPADAHAVLTARFPADQILSASRSLQRQYVNTLFRAGISGGAVYDGLIALVAREHGEQLLTLDARAARTYRALGIDFEEV